MRYLFLAVLMLALFAPAPSVAGPPQDAVVTGHPDTDTALAADLVAPEMPAVDVSQPFALVDEPDAYANRGQTDALGVLLRDFKSVAGRIVAGTTVTHTAKTVERATWYGDRREAVPRRC